MSYHVPVLCEATLDGLVHDPDGLYADCTLGGGGHSERLLARLSPKASSRPIPNASPRRHRAAAST